ncbi:ribosomal large subunit pseudouridine synthase E [Gloeobacter kilaueensis JS1]|uniref:Pseudouridine synthase n=2 Tax=Gloeobacter TaxID=33071 RepID=U5QJ82_GLOK1|nr:ribosomal large subunit pseudouridine synthase E [Gloeobacter kilaueensis JS1]
MAMQSLLFPIEYQPSAHWKYRTDPFLELRMFRTSPGGPHLRYICFYKPYGVLTQFSDSQGRPTLKHFIDVPDVYPVGRLDRDSEGLLLLSDDGAFAHRLTDPRYGHPRTYWAQVEGVPEAAALERLRIGVELDRVRTRPAQVDGIAPPSLPERSVAIRYRAHIPTSWLSLTLTEGRNRQVRRMTAAVGHPTLRLVRVAVGQLFLGDLVPGQWRDLTAQELRLSMLKLAYKPTR